MPRFFRPHHEPNDFRRRFGDTCPACNADLAGQVEVDPDTGRLKTAPAALLEVDDQGKAWRLRLLQGPRVLIQSKEAKFYERNVAYVYLLCGDGHIFPDRAPIHFSRADRAKGEHVEKWNMAAAIGAPASGKTYLLLRTLRQSLNNEANIIGRTDGTSMGPHALWPLERQPLEFRSNEYSKTRSDGVAISPTTTEELAMPASILQRLLPEAYDAVKQAIEEFVVGGKDAAQRWGKNIRQPLILRARSGDKVSWTGVADLPGEAFLSDVSRLRERAKLGSYNALVWVVDPAVAAGIETLLYASGHVMDINAVLAGSLRPGSTTVAGTEQVRTNREHIQFRIGKALTEVYSDFHNANAGIIDVLIAITKCDLIEAALHSGKGLAGFGENDVVLRGTATYLLRMATRLASEEIQADRTTRRILQIIRGAGNSPDATRETRARHIAGALLSHYSSPDQFWNLVHHGRPESLRVEGHGDDNRPALTLNVPSIGDHVDHCHDARDRSTLLTRDMVMSAIGCGLAQGLGYVDAVYTMLANRHQRLRFFLCSPLARLPVDEDGKLKAIDNNRFPHEDERSAGLTQLLFAMLERLRTEQ